MRITATITSEGQAASNEELLRLLTIDDMLRPLLGGQSYVVDDTKELVISIFSVGSIMEKLTNTSYPLFELVQDGWTIGWAFGTQYEHLVTVMIDSEQTETATQMLQTQDLASAAGQYIRSTMGPEEDYMFQTVNLSTGVDAELRDFMESIGALDDERFGFGETEGE